MRTTCWEAPMTLVFRDVARAWSVKRPSTATPNRTISCLSQ